MKVLWCEIYPICHLIFRIIVFTVLPFRVGKRDVKLFENLFFLLQEQQKLSKKVLKKIVNSVPSTLFAGTIFPAGLFSSKWPPLNIWVVTFFRLCSRSVKSCCWAWLSYDLLKSLKKRFEIISIFSRPTLNCGCRESAASVRMTAYIKKNCTM